MSKYVIQAAAEKSAAAVSGSKEKHSSPERKGRVCAGNPSGDSCTIKISRSREWF